MIEKRDKELEGTLNYRENYRTESLDMINKKFIKMHSAQGEFEGTLNSIGQRQNDMIQVASPNHGVVCTEQKWRRQQIKTAISLNP